MLILGAVWLLMAAQAASTEPVWIAWEPSDPGKLETLRREVEAWSGTPAFTVEEVLADDPLRVVPDERFREALPQLRADDHQLQYCGWRNRAWMEFSFDSDANGRITRKFVRCDNAANRRESACRFETRSETVQHVGTTGLMYTLSDDVSLSEARELMNQLAAGRFASADPRQRYDSPLKWWPPVPAVISRPWSPDRKGRKDLYQLAFKGCECDAQWLLEYGSRRTRSGVAIVELANFCVTYVD